MPHLHGASSQAALVGLPEAALLSFAARSRGFAALAGPLARPHDAGNGDRRSQRRPALGRRSDPLPFAPTATAVVGLAIPALPGQHVFVAAALSLDRAESLPAERRAD